MAGSATGDLKVMTRIRLDRYPLDENQVRGVIAKVELVASHPGEDAAVVRPRRPLKGEDAGSSRDLVAATSVRDGGTRSQPRDE